MKKNLYNLVFLLFVIIVFIYSSCKKTEVDTETQSATDNSICEAEFTKILPAINETAISQPGIKKILSGCDSIWVDSSYSSATSYWPRKLYIDYKTGCTGSDGKTRKGLVTVELTKRWSQLGMKAMIAFTNYYVDDLKYEGTVVITRNSSTSFTKTVTGGKCISANWTLEWATSRTIIFNDNGTSINGSDDTYTIEAGSTTTGKTREGKTYSSKVTKALVKKSGCNWIESGTFDLTPQDHDTRTVDFGDGSCDDKATLTIKSNTFTFTLN